MESHIPVEMFDDFLAHVKAIRQRTDQRAAEAAWETSPDEPAVLSVEALAELESWATRTAALGARVEEELAQSASALEQFLAQTEALLNRLRSESLVK
jgi:hypothetical protein